MERAPLMSRDQDETYEQWLKANPAPNFAALIAHHGGYEAIPPQAWTAFGDAKLG
jgi:methyl coenzyme M reductase alpha subunit